MDILLKNGQHAVDDLGAPIEIFDTSEIIQRAIIRLSVKKGSFPHDPELGSELYKLHRSNSKTTQNEALSYVQEALRPIPEIEVLSAHCSFPYRELLKLEIEIKYNKNILQIEVSL